MDKDSLRLKLTKVVKELRCDVDGQRERQKKKGQDEKYKSEVYMGMKKSGRE